MRDCIFCTIIEGVVPCMKIYEDEHTYSFMDIAKDVDGQKDIKSFGRQLRL